MSSKSSADPVLSNSFKVVETLSEVLERSLNDSRILTQKKSSELSNKEVDSFLLQALEVN